MSCANCGAQTPSQATQCPSCGLPLASSSPPPSWDAPPAASQWGAPSGQPYQPYPSGWNEPPQGSSGRLAGWWRRVGATILDGLIIFVPARIIESAAGRGAYYTFFFLATVVYTTVMLTNRGQTLGMMAVGTKCVREGTGTYLSYGPALGRWAMTELLAITIVGGLLDVLWPLWDANNQTLHDKVVHSLVVRVR